jgi:hypothetical protein
MTLGELAVTEAPGSGAPVSSMTWPWIDAVSLVWADREAATRNKIVRADAQDRFEADIFTSSLEIGIHENSRNPASRAKDGTVGRRLLHLMTAEISRPSFRRGLTYFLSASFNEA